MGAVTVKQQAQLYPLTRLLLNAGRSTTAVKKLTGLGWRALKAIRNMTYNHTTGSYVPPVRKQRSDRRGEDAEERVPPVVD